MADTSAISTGRQQRDHGAVADLMRPRWPRLPYGEQARKLSAEPVGRIGSKVKLRFSDRGIAMAAPWRVIGEVQLDLMRWLETGWPFAYSEVLGPLRREAYLDADFQANGAAMAVWKVPGGSTRPWDFRRSRSSRESAAIPDPFLAGRAIAVSEIGPMPARNCCAGFTATLDGNGRMGKLRKFCAL